MDNNKEIWTIYSKQGTAFRVKRLLSSGNGLILLAYDIDTSEPEITRQSFIRREWINDGEDEMKIKAGNPGFDWVPYTETPLLFVQLDPSVFEDAMEALDERHIIEGTIHERLASKNLGYRLGGDLGPGGVNMVFEVRDIEKAKEIILDVLKERGFENKAVIGRRINITQADWFYEVIDPIDFDGVFMTI